MISLGRNDQKDDIDMTRIDYKRAAEIVAGLKYDSLQQAQVYRAFSNFFRSYPNFNPSKFDDACDIADPNSGLKPAKKLRPLKVGHLGV